MYNLIASDILTLHCPFFIHSHFHSVLKTLDAIDGKQARRTGASSPLGQLFDHGCDAVCTALSCVYMASVLRTGTTHLTILLTVTHLMTFFSANWEESQTGIMRFGAIGVTEAQDICIGVQLAAGIWGSELWATPVTHGFVVRDFLVAFVFIAASYQVVECFFVARRHLATEGPASAVSWNTLYEFFLYCACSALWMLAPNDNLFKDHNIIMILSIGFGFSFAMVC
jgi:ethanolaminephosphotransferase